MALLRPTSTHHCYAVPRFVGGHQHLCADVATTAVAAAVPSAALHAPPPTREVERAARGDQKRAPVAAAGLDATCQRLEPALPCVHTSRLYTCLPLASKDESMPEQGRPKGCAPPSLGRTYHDRWGA